jgi:hypothetical protein
MNLRFSKSISTMAWTLAITAGVPFGNFAWAEPLHSDASVPMLITDETIEFKTLIPDRPIMLPKEGKQKAIEKFGIRITNHGKTKKIFFPDFVKLSVLDKDGELIRLTCGSLRAVEINQSSFRSLMPGESVEFLYPAGLGWDGRAWQLGYWTDNGEGCFISGVKAGKYSMRPLNWTFSAINHHPVDAGKSCHKCLNTVEFTFRQRHFISQCRGQNRQ